MPPWLPSKLALLKRRLKKLKSSLMWSTLQSRRLKLQCHCLRPWWLRISVQLLTTRCSVKLVPFNLVSAFLKRLTRSTRRLMAMGPLLKMQSKVSTWWISPSLNLKRGRTNLNGVVLMRVWVIAMSLKKKVKNLLQSKTLMNLLFLKHYKELNPLTQDIN